MKDSTEIKVLAPVQKWHPDLPSTGWSLTVLDCNGHLYIRLYGDTEKQVRARAEAVFPKHRIHEAQS